MFATSASTSIDLNDAKSSVYVAAPGNDNALTDASNSWGSVQIKYGISVTTDSATNVLQIGDGSVGMPLVNGGTTVAAGVPLAFSGVGSLISGATAVRRSLATLSRPIPV